MSKGHSNALGNFICCSAQFRPNFGILAMILSQARYSEARMFLQSIRRNGVGPSIAAVVVRSGQNTTDRNSRECGRAGVSRDPDIVGFGWRLPRLTRRWKWLCSSWVRGLVDSRAAVFIGVVTLASLLFLVRQDPGLENRRTRQPRDVKNFLFVEGFPRQQGFD